LAIAIRDAHTHHTTDHHLACYWKIHFCNFLILKRIEIKKAPAVAEAFALYFKNLKSGNSVLCGNLPHHTTHIANCKFHFFTFSLRQTSELFLNSPNRFSNFNI